MGEQSPYKKRMIVMIYFGLDNYYGSVMAYEKEGKYFMGLDDYDHMAVIEISQKFYEAIEQEFVESRV
jgi:hypothetical protein